jgi:acyl-CoA dehydrogenase
MKRTIYEAEHEAFRQTVKDYIERELVPNSERWEQERLVDRSAYTAAGKYGLIGFNMPEEFGGGGTEDFRSTRSSTRRSPRPVCTVRH